ncbi:hypothetical protein [Gimibacter soli]|uniref:Uncharacterized protein n=1 Tax=Gimibacter soli TaxID=3024400 RepID=A0AAF0BJL5_9PROT|nr:hypothetical protein [Gimibacter soli]WCL53249.1 hypothetical protein PH603_11955 [Gimibacter soli]
MTRPAVAILSLFLAACGGEGTSEGQSGQDANQTRATYGSSRSQSGGNSAVPGNTSTSSGVDRLKLGGGTLAYPDYLQVVALAFRLRGEALPIEEWTRWNIKVTNANEFERPARHAEVMAEYRAIDASTAGIGHLRILVRSRLMEYDIQRQGFPLQSIGPGTTYEYEAQIGKPYKAGIRLENATEAGFWPIPPAEAQALINRIRTVRMVDAHLDLDITGIDTRGKVPVILANVTEFRLNLEKVLQSEEIAHVRVK